LAVLDAEQNSIVLRIVYDGPPEAGKTTSLRALSASLARPMTTPAEIGERTLFFDWVEYTGGLFEGHQIRCQIVSVPGQAVLAHRRTSLLQTADAVVFVSDSSPSAVETTRSYLAEMRTALDEAGGPRVGVILQANKRDRPDAVDVSALQAAAPGTAVLESVATSGTGVRETFVFAVRLALDRVRELLRTRTLSFGAPDVQTSDQLLAQLQHLESERTAIASRQGLEDSTQASSAFREVIDEHHSARATSPGAATLRKAAESDAPHPPTAGVESGTIWPPVDGRIILQEACAQNFVPRRLQDGDWIGEVEGWKFHAPRQAIFTDPESGRRSLIDWARLHAAGQRWFSGPRVVVLAPSGPGTWRLWQIVKREESLRDVLVQAIEDNSPEGLLRRLLQAGRQLLTAIDSLAFAPCRLAITVDTVGVTNGGPLYIGYLPGPFLIRPGNPMSAENRTTLLRRELGALASSELRTHPKEAFPPLGSIIRRSDPPAVVEALRVLLRDSGLVDDSVAGTS